MVRILSNQRTVLGKCMKLRTSSHVKNYENSVDHAFHWSKLTPRARPHHQTVGNVESRILRLEMKRSSVRTRYDAISGTNVISRFLLVVQPFLLLQAIVHCYAIVNNNRNDVVTAVQN
jgi:hypothetical protein